MPLKTPVAVFLLLAAAVLSPLSPTPAARAQEAPPQRVFGDVIEVRAVQVEVAVTNPAGERIEGLDAASFRLLVDGRRVDLDYFREVRGGTVRNPATAEGVEPVPVGAATDSVRSFLVFIDDYFTDRRFRQRLLSNLAENVEGLRPGDRMAVVRFEGYGLEVLSPWTDSKEQLRGAVLEARKRTPRELIRATQASVPANPVEAARLLGRQITEVTGAMGAAMRAFSDTPGRKLFLPVSTGWPFDPSRELGNPFTDVAAERRAGFEVAPTAGGFQEPGVDGPEDRVLTDPSLQRGPETINPDVDDLTTIADAYHYRSVELLYPLTDTANLLGWTVYPMHIGGPSEVERASLWIVARDTGGRIATQGAANTRPLDPVVDDTGSYYVLGYSPTRARDDARHRLEVELVGAGLEEARVRHRREFRDLSRRAQQALKVEEALLLGTGGGDLDAIFGDVPKGGRSVELPVTLRIPMDWVTMVPQADGRYAGSLELRIAALDKRGGRSEIPAIPVELVGGKPAPGSVALYETAIRLRRTEQRVVLFLYDTLSGEVRGTSLAFQP